MIKARFMFPPHIDPLLFIIFQLPWVRVVEEKEKISGQQDRYQTDYSQSEQKWYLPMARNSFILLCNWKNRLHITFRIFASLLLNKQQHTIQFVNCLHVNEENKNVNFNCNRPTSLILVMPSL